MVAMCLIREAMRIACLRKKGVTSIFIRNLANKCGGSSGDNTKKGDGSGQKGEKETGNSKSNPCPCAPTMYDCRKYGHSLPSNELMPCFDPVPNVPTGVFRCSDGEVLGPGAHKCSCYPCPEYFAYHHMTFYDIHLILGPYRQPSPKTGRKP